MALNSSLDHVFTKRAYVTFLAGNGDYVKGVVALAKCLRKVNNAYPLVVVVLPDVPEDHRKTLRSQGCAVHEMEPVHPWEGQVEFTSPQAEALYSKLCVWNLEEYNKMIYMDADILVVDNIDHLFDMPDGYFYAVPDCFCEWRESPLYAIGYCQQCPDKVRWPAEMGSPPPLYFNSGFFVFEPSHETYQNMLKTLQITPPTPTPFPDQDFLNIFCKHKFKPIPVVYNLVLAILWHHPEKIELEKVKVVHYCAIGSKPWKYNEKEANMDREDVKMLVAKWWDIYNDKLLDFKSEDSVPVRETLSSPSIMASTPAFPAQE